MARFQGAGTEISSYFDILQKHVYTERDLRFVLDQRRHDWHLPERTTTKTFISFLVSKTKMKKVSLRSERYRGVERYVWGDVSPYPVGLSLNRDSYLSHATAAFLHTLTGEKPSCVYVNHEQSPKPRSSDTVSQDSLNRAFASKQRRSNYILGNDAWQFVLLNGKQTGRLGVIKIATATGDALQVTGVERTLIDIAVRPDYAGGPHQVLQAYKVARGRVSAEALMNTLRELDYVYPFHQAVGFYMQRAGYDYNEWQMMKTLPMNFDFYLAHDIQDKDFDSSWRIFFPRGL